MRISVFSNIVLGIGLFLCSSVVLSQTDFQLTVSPNGNPIVLSAGGGTQLLTYTVTNDVNGLDEGDQTTITFNLNPQIEPAFITSSDSNWLCIPVTAQITCNYNGNYSAGYSSDLILNITAPINPTLVTAAIDADITNALGDPNPGNDQIVSDINFISGGIDLSIDKSMTGGFSTTVTPGAPISFDITVTNLSGQDATNVVVMDDLIVNNIQFDALGSSPECQDLASFIQCDVTSLFAGDSVIFTVAGTVSTAAQPGNYINTATVSANETDIDNSNNSSDQAFNVVVGGAAEVVLTKSIFGGASQIVQGDTFEYDIQLNNTGSVIASNVNFVDTLPPEVTYISHTPLGNFTCSYTAPTISCDAANLPNATAEDGVRILVSADGAINSSVSNTATSSFVDGNSANNTDSVAFTIMAPSVDLDLTMTAGASNYTVGDLINLGLQVHNPFGSGGAPPNVAVTTTLTNEMVFNSAQAINATGWVCTHDGSPFGGDVICDSQGNAVAEGSVTNIEIIAAAATAGSTITPSAVMTSDFDPNPSNDIANATFQINSGSADLSLQFTSASGVYEQGDIIIYDIQVNNPMGSSASPTDVAVDINLPAEVAFSSTDLTNAPGWICHHDGLSTGGQITCGRQGNPFVPFSTHDIQVHVVATSLATSAVAQATISSAADSVLTNNSGSQADVINTATSDFSLTLRSQPIQVNPGQTFTHIATIYNSGNSALTSVNSVLVFPSHAQLQTVQSADMTCTTSGGAVNCSNNQVMMPGQSYSINYEFTTSGQSQSVDTSMAVNADGISKSTSVSTYVNNFGNSFDLTLTKTASVTQVEQRGEFKYLFDIQNVGSSTQNDFALTDQLPNDVIFQGYSGSGWSCSGTSVIECQFNGVLNAGAITQLEFDVLAPGSLGRITNTATLTAINDDNLSNNQSTADVNVTESTGGGDAIADIAIEITTDAAEVLSSEEVIWFVEVSNEGPDTASNIRVVNDFPMGFNATEVLVDNGASCVILSSSLMCEMASLAVNEVAQIQLKGGFSTGFTGMIMNMIEVSADSIDPNTSNNQSSSQLNVVIAEELNADLSLELQADAQEIRQGQSFEMSLHTNNVGPNRAVNAVLTTEVSGLISQVQVVNSGQWMCQSTNHSISCQFPGNYQVGLSQTIDVLVTTEQVVQTSEPINVNAMIESVAMDPNPANNMDSLNNAVSRTPTEEEIFAEFENAVGSGASETVLNTIRNVSSYCARSYFMAIEGLCEEMISAATPENRTDIINAMEEMTPNEVIGQSTSAAEMMTSQFRNVTSRLAQLRGGGGAGVSLAGLTAQYGNESLPLGMLAYLNQSEDEAANVSNINDFVSPWGFFVNGNISMGERDATGRELGFDFDTYGLTAGVDYRFSPTKVAGLALGYANFDSEIEDEAEMKSTGFTLTGYGSFYLKDNFYVDARISYANPDFEQKRRINFELDNINIDRIATGKTNANQYTVAMSMGYHFNKNSWNITPNASLRYARTTIDAFRESGAGDFNFRFGEQEVKSMVWSFGTSVSKAISLKNGVLSPQFDINISRETENDGGAVEAWFINAPNDEIFLIQTDEPDRTYGSAGVGLVFIGANGKQAYINYKSIFGLDGFTRGTINLGARFEF